ncbi:MAG: helix-turn-helix domain-containing protein [Mycobacterium sp.]
MSVLADHTVLPDHDSGFADVMTVVKHLQAGGRGVITCGDQSAELPAELADVLVRAVQALAEGQAVTISPHRTTLTTQEAAEILGVSRPTLVKLLKEDKIPFTQPGRHRRVQLADVLAFQEHQARARAEALDELANAPDPDQGNAVGFVNTR